MIDTRTDPTTGVLDATRSRTRPLMFHERKRLNALVDLGVVIREVVDGEVKYRRNPAVVSVTLRRLDR